MPFEIQTLICPKDKWESLDAVKEWLRDHNYRTDKLDETEDSWRFRQRDPDDFERLRTICINPGTDTALEDCKVKAVGGPLKQGRSIESKAAVPNLERHYLKTEWRAESDQDKKFPHLVGYPAVYDQFSEDLCGFKERIAKGAFKDVLNQDTVCLLNHDPNYILGRTEAGTLKLKEDDHGLMMDASPPGTQWANDLMVSVGRGDINRGSFGFIADEDIWERQADGMNLRTVLHVQRLYDVSLVTFPAYPQTEIALRSLFQANGLDYSALSRVFVRGAHSLPFTDQDRELVGASIEILKSLTGGKGAAGAEGRETQGRNIDLLRKQLALAELEI